MPGISDYSPPILSPSGGPSIPFHRCTGPRTGWTRNRAGREVALLALTGSWDAHPVPLPSSYRPRPDRPTPPSRCVAAADWLQNLRESCNRSAPVCTSKESRFALPSRNNWKFSPDSPGKVMQLSVAQRIRSHAEAQSRCGSKGAASVVFPASPCRCVHTYLAPAAGDAGKVRRRWVGAQLGFAVAALFGASTLAVGAAFRNETAFLGLQLSQMRKPDAIVGFGVDVK